MNIKHILSGKNTSTGTQISEQQQQQRSESPRRSSSEGASSSRTPAKRVLGGGSMGFQSHSTKGARGRVCESGVGGVTGPAPQFCWTRAGFWWNSGHERPVRGSLCSAGARICFCTDAHLPLVLLTAFPRLLI